MTKGTIWQVTWRHAQMASVSSSRWIITAQRRAAQMAHRMRNQYENRADEGRFRKSEIASYSAVTCPRISYLRERPFRFSYTYPECIFFCASLARTNSNKSKAVSPNTPPIFFFLYIWICCLSLAVPQTTDSSESVRQKN